MNITLDGFISGAHCELDWHFKSWTSRMAEALAQQLSRADTIVLGRVTYCAMARFWMSRSSDLNLPREDLAFADMMNRYNKIVFTKTMERTCWPNSVIKNGTLRKEITRLKEQPGKDLIVYGSGKLVNALIQLNLVDEYTLWVHPVILGKGKTLFSRSSRMMALDLVNTETFSSGVVKMDFRPAGSNVVVCKGSFAFSDR
jgi:dihydrofolate reductase